MLHVKSPDRKSRKATGRNVPWGCCRENGYRQSPGVITAEPVDGDAHLLLTDPVKHRLDTPPTQEARVSDTNPKTGHQRVVIARSHSWWESVMGTGETGHGARQLWKSRPQRTPEPCQGETDLLNQLPSPGNGRERRVVSRSLKGTPQQGRPHF